jgi:hypothetical protein
VRRSKDAPRRQLNKRSKPIGRDLVDWSFSWSWLNPLTTLSRVLGPPPFSVARDAGSRRHAPPADQNRGDARGGSPLDRGPVGGARAARPPRTPPTSSPKRCAPKSTRSPAVPSIARSARAAATGAQERRPRAPSRLRRTSPAPPRMPTAPNTAVEAPTETGSPRASIEELPPAPAARARAGQALAKPGTPRSGKSPRWRWRRGQDRREGERGHAAPDLPEKDAPALPISGQTPPRPGPVPGRARALRWRPTRARQA